MRQPASDRTPAGGARMMRAQVIDPAAEAPVDRGAGVRTWKLVTRARGADAFLSGITEFDAGASLPLHFHNCQESVVVLEGVARCQVEEEARDLTPNTCTFIEAGVPHRFENPGSGRLRILFTY